MQGALAVDLGLLTIDSNHGRKHVLKQVKSILKLKSLQESVPWLRLTLPSNSIRLLQEVSAYPSQDWIYSQLANTDLKSLYSAKDISRQIDQILSVGTVEMATGCEDILWEDFESQPKVDEIHSSAPLADSLKRTLLLILVRPNLRSIAMPIATLLEEKEIQIKANAIYILPENIQSLTPEHLPKILSGKIHAASDVESICDLIDPLDVWNHVDETMDLNFSIQLMCRRLLKADNNYQGWKSIPKFSIGDQFRNSLNLWSAGPNSEYGKIALEKAASTILRHANIQISVFTTTGAPGAEPRRRDHDKATAMRVHVTESHQALRLMLWELHDKSFELANIGPKFELKIC